METKTTHKYILFMIAYRVESGDYHYQQEAYVATEQPFVMSGSNPLLSVRRLNVDCEGTTRIYYSAGNIIKYATSQVELDAPITPEQYREAITQFWKNIG